MFMLFIIVGDLKNLFTILWSAEANALYLDSKTTQSDALYSPTPKARWLLPELIIKIERRL